MVFAAAIATATGQLPFTALPTLALLGCLLVRAPVVVAAYAAASVWLVLLPGAPGEAMLVPVTMIALCVAIAVGPDRLLAWLARAAPGSGREVPDEGWIEEEPRRVG